MKHSIRKSLLYKQSVSYVIGEPARNAMNLHPTLVFSEVCIASTWENVGSVKK